jgi:hypothetical protein
MLCGSVWRGVAVNFPVNFAAYYEELQDLCIRAGDNVSLVIGMTGMACMYMAHGQVRDASRLASEQMALLESIGDPVSTVGAMSVAIVIKCETGEMADIFRWSQTVIELAEGDPAKGGRAEGNLTVTSPLAVFGLARCCSMVAGTSWLASGPRRRRSHGPTPRPRDLRGGH